MKRKRFISLSLAVTMFVGLMPNLSIASNRLPFNDLNLNDKYYEPIQYVYEKEIMNGMGDGNFSPDRFTTRGELVTVLYRMAGEPKVSGEHFIDVPEGAFYGDAVHWASKHQIVNGYGDGKFEPNRIITREELITIFYRYANHCGINTENMTIFSQYEDSRRVSSYAFEPINWALHYELITAGDNKIHPRQLASRGEIANVIWRYFESAAKEAAPRLSEGQLKQQLKGVWKVTGIYRDEFDRDYEDLNTDYEYITNLQIRFDESKYQIYTPYSDDLTKGDYKIVADNPGAKMIKLKIREEGLYGVDYVENRRDYFDYNSRYNILGLAEDMGETVMAIHTNAYYKVEFLDEDHIRLYFSDNKVLNCTYLRNFNLFETSDAL